DRVDADVPSRLPAAQPRRQATRVAGYPAGHAGARPARSAGMKLRRAVAALVAIALAVAVRARADEPALERIVIDGSINPAVVEYVREGIARASAEGRAALVIQLDTPGGLLQSARTMVKDILGAPLPVIVYVAPSGAGAASAGAFVTMAGHLAAIATRTSIGAGHPGGGQGEEVPGGKGEKPERFTASF